MKKLYYVMFIVFVLILSISCGKKESNTGVIVLKGYRQFDPAHPQSKVENIILEEFNKAYTNIKIEWEYVNGEPYHQKFQAMAASGTIPDIFTIYLGARTAYITDRGLAMDITPFLTDDIKKQYNENVWDAQGKNGEIYFISPNLAVCHVMYANTDLMKKLGLTFPKTQEELIAQGEIIRKAGLTPISIGNQADWVMNSFFLSTLTDRFGGKEWFEKAVNGEAKFSDENFVQALTVIKTLLDNKMFNPGILQMTQAQALEEFVQQKSVYLIDAAWRIAAMKNVMTPEQLAAVDMYVYPAAPGETEQGSSSVTLGEGFGINAKLDKVKADAAMKFMLFETGKEAAKLKMEGGTVTTYKLNADEYNVDPLTKKYIKFLDITPMGYVIDAKMDAEGMGVLNPAIQSMMLGRKTPKQVADEYEAWVAQNDSHRKK